MNKTRKLTALAAATAALAMLLAGCGAGNGNGSSNASSATEPPAGIDSSYTGDLPMPKVTERYDNHQSRDNVKDGGTLTLSITEVGPNWNYLSSDGNTGYMSELWSWYQPSLLMTDQVNGSPIKVNPDFLTDMKLVSKDPMVVQYDINRRPSGTTAPTSTGPPSRPCGKPTTAPTRTTTRRAPTASTVSPALSRATARSRSR